MKIKIEISLILLILNLINLISSFIFTPIDLDDLIPSASSASKLIGFKSKSALLGIDKQFNDILKTIEKSKNWSFNKLSSEVIKSKSSQITGNPMYYPNSDCLFGTPNPYFHCAVAYMRRSHSPSETIVPMDDMVWRFIVYNHLYDEQMSQSQMIENYIY